MIRTTMMALALLLLLAPSQAGESPKDSPLLMVAAGLRKHFAQKGAIDADYRFLSGQLSQPNRPVAQLFENRKVETKGEKEVLLGATWMRLRIGFEPIPLTKKLTPDLVASAGDEMVRAQFLSNPTAATVYLYNKKTKIGQTRDRKAKAQLEWYVQEGKHRVEFEKSGYLSFVGQIDIDRGNRVIDQKLTKK